jgi:hypothetical protein
LGVHQADEGLRVGVPLLGGLAVPDHGLRVVLRDALAARVHHAEAKLREGVPLLGQRTQNLQFRRVVAFLIGSLGVLKRSRPCYAEGGERENAAGKESCDPLFHGSPPQGKDAAPPNETHLVEMGPRLLLTRRCHAVLNAWGALIHDQKPCRGDRSDDRTCRLRRR